MYTSNPPSRVSSPNLLCIGCSSPISFFLRLQALNKGNGLRYKPLNLKSRSSAAPLLTLPPNLMMINLRTRRFLSLHPLQKSIQPLTHRITHTTVTYLSFIEYHSGLLQIKVVFPETQQKRRKYMYIEGYMYLILQSSAGYRQFILDKITNMSQYVINSMPQIVQVIIQ